LFSFFQFCRTFIIFKNTFMLRRWLQKAPSFYFVSFAMLAAFGAYFCMYA